MIGEVKITDIEAVIGPEFIADGELLLRAGKKRYFRVVVTG